MNKVLAHSLETVESGKKKISEQRMKTEMCKALLRNKIINWFQLAERIHIICGVKNGKVDKSQYRRSWSLKIFLYKVIRMMKCGLVREPTKNVTAIIDISCFCQDAAVVQLLSHVRLFATPWIAACQASLSITNSQVYSNSCPWSWWCLPNISSSVVPFSSCLQSFPASEFFQMSQLFTAGGKSIAQLKKNIVQENWKEHLNKGTKTLLICF